MSQPTIQRLDSGYWLVRWAREVWAQWPMGRAVRPEDFFHAAWSCTADRMAQCDRLAELEKRT